MPSSRYDEKIVYRYILVHRIVMQILTIETTCDETAAAVVTDKLEIRSSVVAPR